MKKIIAIVLFVLLGSLLNLVIPEIAMARVFRVFGPETFVRSSKGGETIIRQFPVQYPRDYNFTLHLFYTGEKNTVPRSLIKINGKKIIRAPEFTRKVHYIKKPITLSEANSISVQLRGKRGSGLTMIITAQNDEPRVFDFRETVHPDGIGLFGRDLNYIWSITKEPEAGSAYLLDPDSAAPSLAANLPGEYMLEMRIRGDSWEERFPIKLSAVDMSAASYNDTPYIPVPIKTRVLTGTGDQYGDYSIKVGSTSYIAPAPSNCGSASNSGFQVLVLDRASLAFKNHRTFNVPCGSNDMVTFLNTMDDTSLVIISSLNNAAPNAVCGGSPSCTLGAKLKEFGATDIFSAHYSSNLSYTLSDGSSVVFNYSLIGIRGVQADQGYELNNWDHRAVTLDSERIYSNIEGYFVQDVNPTVPTSKWTFIYPGFIAIETHAQTAAKSNTMKVGDLAYPSEPLEYNYSSYVGGFQVLVLDRDTLKPTASISEPNKTFWTGFTINSWYAVNDGLNAMYGYLSSILNTVDSQRYVVVIASIGSPISTFNASEDSQPFNNLVNTIGNYYGGTLGVLNQIAANPMYSLIGMSSGTAYPFGAQDSVEANSTGVNLRVTLQKNKQGWFSPVITNPQNVGATDGPDTSLLSVALQPYTPWPLPDPALSSADPLYQEQVAAYKYLSSHVGEITDDIRSYYTKGVDPAVWIGKCDSDDTNYPATTPNPYFSPAVFDSMKEQLCGYYYDDNQGLEQYAPGEFDYILRANGLLAQTHNVLTNMKLSSTDSLRNVYEKVKVTVDVPPDKTVLYNTGIIIRGILTAGTSIVTNPGLKAAMGTINGIMSIAMGISKDEGGADYTSLNTAVSNLDNQMDNLWASCDEGSQMVLDIVKSDWGKLQYVGNKLMTPQEEGGWMWDDSDPGTWVKQVTNTLQAYFFQSLMPAVWKIDYLQNSTTIPHPKNLMYMGSSGYPCMPYCQRDASSACWVDTFTPSSTTHQYSWYVLEDEIDYASGCGFVHFDRSVGLRDVLFGEGIWSENGVPVGVKLDLPPAVFFERWLPSSVYRLPIFSPYNKVIADYANCSF